VLQATENGTGLSGELGLAVRACEVEEDGSLGCPSPPSEGSRHTVVAADAVAATAEDSEADTVGRASDAAAADPAEVGPDYDVEGNGWDEDLEGASHSDTGEPGAVCCRSCSGPDRMEQVGMTGKSSSGSVVVACHFQRCRQRQRRAGLDRRRCHCRCSSHTLCPAESRSPP
jgi:hypothetical protein